MNVNPTSATLAPGRDTWLFVSTFVQTSPTSMSRVPPEVSFESTAPEIAEVSLDSAGLAHVIAKRPGSAAIMVRSRREPANVVRVLVEVNAPPVGDDSALAMSATAVLKPSHGSTVTEESLGPSELEVTVRITNPTATTKDIWLSGCPAWIRIYSTPVDTGKPLADIPRGAQCMGSTQHVTFAPGESKTFNATGFRLSVSSDTLPNTPVYVFAAVDRLRDLVNVPAGPLDVGSPNAGLTLAGTTTLTGTNADTLRARITITNTTSRPVRLEYGACSVHLLAYRSPDRSGTPVWNSDVRRAPAGAVYACPAYLAVGVVKPGETVSPREFNVIHSVREMLGDSATSGRYYFKARVDLNWRVIEVDAGDLEVRR